MLLSKHLAVCGTCRPACLSVPALPDRRPRPPMAASAATPPPPPGAVGAGQLHSPLRRPAGDGARRRCRRLAPARRWCHRWCHRSAPSWLAESAGSRAGMPPLPCLDYARASAWAVVRPFAVHCLGAAGAAGAAPGVACAIRAVLTWLCFVVAPGGGTLCRRRCMLYGLPGVRWPERRPRPSRRCGGACGCGWTCGTGAPFGLEAPLN